MCLGRMELRPVEFEGARTLSLGVISDTHGLLRPEAIRALAGVDLILHGGDVGREMILDELEGIAPVYTVRGNVDYEVWCGRLPNVLTLHLGALAVHMVHDIGHLDPLNLTGVNLVVFGHSHKPEFFERDGITFLNPGSAGPRRFTLPVTLATLSWVAGQEKFTPELIHLLP